MPIDISCSCGRTLNVPNTFAGKNLPCPGCGKPIAVSIAGVVVGNAVEPPPLPSDQETRSPMTRRARKNTAGQAFLAGLGCFGFAVLLFLILYGLEQSGSGANVHWLIAVLYYVGGKWLVSGLLTVLGTICFIAGFVELFSPRK